MASEGSHRKLAAIPCADVAGYSRLMGENEEAALAALHACRALIDQEVRIRDGRIFGSAGDRVIAPITTLSGPGIDERLVAGSHVRQTQMRRVSNARAWPRDASG